MDRGKKATDGPGLSPSERIQVILHEYDTLRDEVSGRTRDGFNLFATGVGVSIGSLWALYGVLGAKGAITAAFVVAVSFALAWRVTYEGIARTSARIAKIESDVNAIAGEKLLVWETRQNMEHRGPVMTWWRKRVRAEEPIRWEVEGVFEPETADARAAATANLSPAELGSGLRTLEESPAEAGDYRSHAGFADDSTPTDRQPRTDNARSAPISAPSAARGSSSQRR